MKRHEHFILLTTLFFLATVYTANAGYWFQTGVRGGSASTHNNGASVQIQTIPQTNLTSGSWAFWVGETLSNGAFLQVGYVIENQTGKYPINCTSSGCSSSEFLNAGHAQWFYEYFTPGANSTFLGSTGPDSSAGKNFSFNTYSFYSIGNTWYFLFNNKTVGSANLGASDSGPYGPIAIGELANTSSARMYMNKVIFSNLSEYKFKMVLPIQNAFGVVSYGIGSKTNLPNPYGVAELANRINYFAVGSGLQLSNNGTQMWALGYRLNISSRYGNLSSKNSYTAYSAQSISVPAIINLSENTRALFTGWTGTGSGSYTGTQNYTQLLMTANLTETANWQVQYFVNVTSPYGKATGTGWYANGSTAAYGIANTTFKQNANQIVSFAKWSTGSTALNSSATVNGPLNIGAVWQYGVSLIAKNAYGQAINVSGFVINGARFNSTPNLYTNVTSSLQGAYYQGIFIPVNSSISITQNSQKTLYVPLPIYNISIRTLGIFGVPVNASVNVVYKNGQTLQTHTGPSGLLNIPNVPYGYGNVTVTYLGSSEKITVSNGNQANVAFVSIFSLLLFAVLSAIAIYLVYLYRKHWLKKSKNRAAGPPRQNAPRG